MAWSPRGSGVDYLDGRWKELLEGTLVDPRSVHARGAVLARQLLAGKDLEISHPNGTRLSLRLRGRKPVVSDGRVRTASEAGGRHMITLPAGVTTVAVDERTAEGVFQGNLANSVGLSDSVGELREGRWSLHHGRLSSYSYEKVRQLFRQSYERAGTGRDRPATVSIDLNPRMERAPLLEDQGLGTITQSVGSDALAGGSNHADWWAWLYLRGGTLRVDGADLVRDGKTLG